MLNQNSELKKFLDLSNHSLSELRDQLHKQEMRHTGIHTEMSGINKKIKELQDQLEMLSGDILDVNEQMRKTRVAIAEIQPIRDQIQAKLKELGETNPGRPNLVVLEGATA